MNVIQRVAAVGLISSVSNGEINMRSVQLLSITVGVIFGVVGAYGTTYALPSTTRPTTTWSPDNPGTTNLNGTLVKVEDTTLTVHTIRKLRDEVVIQDFLIPTDDNTQVIIDTDLGKLKDLKPGMIINCQSVPAVGSNPAKVIITATSMRLSGTIIKIDGNNLLLRGSRHEGSKESTVVTDEDTRIFVPAPQPDGIIRIVEGKLSDLQVGMRISVVPETGIAEKIFVGPNHGRRPTTLPSQ
jgi:hypothetical protein